MLSVIRASFSIGNARQWEGARWRGISRHTQLQQHPPDAHCQAKVGQPTHLPVAWADLAADQPRREHSHQPPPSLAHSFACPLLPTSGCAQCFPKEEGEGPEAGMPQAREAVGRWPTHTGKCRQWLLQQVDPQGALLGLPAAEAAMRGAGGQEHRGWGTYSATSLALWHTGVAGGSIMSASRQPHCKCAAQGCL